MLLTFNAHAQWQSQSFTLKPGWNAIFLHVDASHVLLEELTIAQSGNPIEEVWLWKPVSSTAQFVTSPQSPTAGNSQWSSWKRPLGASSELRRLIPNAGYLVNNPNTTDYVWTIKGRPVPFSFLWSTTGLNFLGFPTPTVNPPLFDPFLTPAPALQGAAEIYDYPGGPLGTNNPQKLLTLNTTPVTRGRAVWMRAGTLYNDYYGPFSVSLPNASGLDFQDTIGQLRVRLVNRTASDQTVTLSFQASEAAPAGQAAIVGAPPLLLRGTRNTTNLTYAYISLNSANATVTLKPKGTVGQEVELVIGVNRSAISGTPGRYAGILRFADGNGLSQHDIPVAATVGSNAGLWVGGAMVNQVRSYLVAFQKTGAGALRQTASGAYIISSVNTNLDAVARPFPLRMILHNSTNNNWVMLQRVFIGLRQQTNLVVATTEKVLDTASLSSARRISAAHLPTTLENAPWQGVGQLGSGALTVTVPLDYGDQQSNPFLHTYHPDHDNLDPDFGSILPQGVESYRVERRLKFLLFPPPADFNGLTRGTTTLAGDYEEVLTLFARPGESRVFESRGAFTLNRISSVGTLTTQ